jgi:hypothetical protein
MRTSPLVSIAILIVIIYIIIGASITYFHKDPYDPRNDPMCDPITGEAKPDACKIQFDAHPSAIPCISFCKISRNATITDVKFNVSGDK